MPHLEVIGDASNPWNASASSGVGSPSASSSQRASARQVGSLHNTRARPRGRISEGMHHAPPNLQAVASQADAPAEAHSHPGRHRKQQHSIDGESADPNAGARAMGGSYSLTHSHMKKRAVPASSVAVPGAGRPTVAAAAIPAGKHVGGMAAPDADAAPRAVADRLGSLVVSGDKERRSRASRDVSASVIREIGAGGASSKHLAVESENSVDTVMNQRGAHLRGGVLSSTPPGTSATGTAEGVVYPLTPAGALRRCVDHLTNYEQSEILDFPQIFYTGRGAKKIQGTPRNPTMNHGYDDDRGDYTVVSHDHIAYRYEVLGVLGKGSFGQVLRCLDHKTGERRPAASLPPAGASALGGRASRRMDEWWEPLHAGKEVAVKVIRNKKRFHHQALVELKILENLRHRDPDNRHNVVHLLEYMYFRSHLCITFELLSINLYDFLKRNHFQGLPVALIRRFAVQVLVSLRFLKRLHIIHCDLKPENILLRHPSKSAITVIDFGSSCFEDEKVYTYIQSRFYRSPEVMLGVPYNAAIDMWSLGCILAELYTGYPLFPGENEQEQVQW